MPNHQSPAAREEAGQIEMFEDARRRAPERTLSRAIVGREVEDDIEAIEGITSEDWMAAERSRPDLPDETVDGLTELEEEVRRQAEDVPLGAPNPLLADYDAPVEPEEALLNQGEFPDLADQGETRAARRRPA